MPAGRKRYEPTEQDRRIVQSMAGCGTQQDSIARTLDIDPKTLRKHYRMELDTSAAKANAQVALTLFKMATSGKHPAATIFWTKARQGWKDSHRFEPVGPGGEALVSLEAVRALFAAVAAARPREDEDEKPVTA